MDGEQARAAAVERLLAKVRSYSVLMYVGTMVVTLGPRMAANAMSPAAVAAAARVVSNGPLTCLLFAAATALLQGKLARVLEREDEPAAGAARAPRLTPLAAWPLAVITWACITCFFFHYLLFGDVAAPSCAGWAVVAVASAANLAIAAHTVNVTWLEEDFAGREGGGAEEFGRMVACLR
ncbi:hypothetical protein ACP70R_004668 [Stipagrostis hirtigluma subsp. patula]